MEKTMSKKYRPRIIWKKSSVEIYVRKLILARNKMKMMIFKTHTLLYNQKKYSMHKDKKTEYLN